MLKAGGSVFVDIAGTRALMEQIGILHQVGIRVVLVHGGGPQSTAMQRSLGIEPHMVAAGASRTTLDRSVDDGAERRDQHAHRRLLPRARHSAIGLSGVDGGLVRANRRPPVQVAGQTVDYGFVGDIVSIDTSMLLKQLDNDLVPIVSPCRRTIRHGAQHQCRHGRRHDRRRAQGREMIVCTGAPGILESLDDPRSLISYIDRAGLRRLEDGKLSGGMLPKVAAIEGALPGGVPRVHVISYASATACLLEVFTNEGTGTLIVNDMKALHRPRNRRKRRPHDAALGQGPAARRAHARFTAGEDHALDERLVAYDVRASIAHAGMLAEERLLSKDDWN